MKAGDVYNTNSSGKLVVLKYLNSDRVEIKFLNTGWKTVARKQNIELGSVKDKYKPDVFGVGVVGCKYATKVNGKHLPEYILWRNMITRCFDTESLSKRPTYDGCTLSENFKSYEYFYEWCQSKIGFKEQGFALDKDLLVKGNKVYSEDTCVFIPTEINTVLNKKAASRGKLPIGVSYHKATGKFRAYVSQGRGLPIKHLGLFETEIEAFQSYKVAKEDYLKELADKWKDQVDPRVYQALNNYQVEITD